jgi:carboxylesterase type B
VTVLVADQTVVRTTLGAVRGVVTDGIHVFRGIPFAAPPFGARRFLPPQPAPPWAGIRDATEWGPEPPQLRPPEDGPVAGMVWDPTTPGEDCLNLNVWTPDPTAIDLPVMVFIPGGMFEVGTGATYDGSRFARDGVVCVTINYRVGPEGFLYLADGQPNLGLLDQIAAFEWVRDNITAFGGDPAAVTIFGESAGAMSVGTLLAIPRAEGLFRRAICQSGAADRVISAEAALRMGGFLAARLGVAANREAMSTVEPDALLAAAAELKADLMGDPDPAEWSAEVVASMLPWQPVIDGEVLPAHPIERIAAGASSAVDVIVGSNLDDWRLFVVVNGSFERVTEESLVGPVERHGFETAAAYGITGAALDAYRERYPATGPAELLSRIETDWWCRVPAIRLAEAHCAAGRTYMYEFGWASPMLGGMFGACHALELPFVFDTLDLGPRQMLGGLLGDGPPQALADAMHGAWVAFATSGDPGWPRYDHQRRATMRFDTASRVVEDPRPFERALWGGLRSSA